MDSSAPPDKLCDRCREFNPSKGKFITNLRTEGSLQGVLNAEYDVTGLESWSLGPLDEIYSRRANCSFCWLIFKATHSSESGTIGYDGLDWKHGHGTRIPCHLEWQLDGRLLNQGQALMANAITRRLRVFSPQGLFPDSHIMLLGADSRASNSDAGVTFLAREIQSPHVDIERLRTWLDLCMTTHSSICKPQRSFSMTDSRHLRFIDVQDNCLVHRRDIEALFVRYATLSYTREHTRGGIGQFTLRRDNLDELSKPGFFDKNANAIPRTIRDTVNLARSLGLRYVWVDALCIVQDDREEHTYTVQIMDKIYAGGDLTICCAAAGHNSQVGLPGTSQTPRSVAQPIVSARGIRLLAARTVESRIGQSTWDTRAWTFQERMLSHRCLIFVEDRVYFQCREATWSEEVDSECSAPTWTLDMMKSPFRSVARNPLRLYTDYVELYSRRVLTPGHGRDRLLAFAGLASILCPPLKAILFFGLPHSHFDFALLWDRQEQGARITHAGFPSWSWCGWEGAVTWRMYMVSSSLLNLHDWLKHHTWIVWYTSWDINVKSGEASLRIQQSPPPQSEVALLWKSRTNTDNPPNRWQGYSSVGTSDEPYGRRAGPSWKKRLPTRPTSIQSGYHCLYFWTWTAFFQLSRQSLSSREFSSSLEPGLHRFGLGDIKGDWCGTIILEKKWFNQIGGIFEFVAISEARDFSMEELDTWNYYFLEDREDSEWYVFYALMIVWDEKHTVAERTGLAKIYQKAFHTGSFQPGKAWREIVLG